MNGDSFLLKQSKRKMRHHEQLTAQVSLSTRPPADVTAGVYMVFRWAPDAILPAQNSNFMVKKKKKKKKKNLIGP